MHMLFMLIWNMAETQIYNIDYIMLCMDVCISIYYCDRSEESKSVVNAAKLITQL